MISIEFGAAIIIIAGVMIVMGFGWYCYRRVADLIDDNQRVR